MANAVSDSVMRAEPMPSAAVRRSAWRRWPKLIFLLVMLVWLANIAVSLSIRHSRLQRKITARLESAFGRPVEVGRYEFSLWGWPTLEAQSITVGDDPRFGHEYFLRAESLTMQLRWRSLLHGRLEFGTFSLVQPSLNLVRNADGDWNLAEWLPRPTVPPGIAPVGPQRPPSPPLRFTRIEVDSGRINFKRGDEKLPFAFVGVKGYLKPETPGRWQLDLEATPMRAAVISQQAGTLHLSGHVGGTSSRLRPAVLDLSWTHASLSDVLRLARNSDYGVRGSLTLLLHAQTDAETWLLQGRAELRQIHRWDLSLRPDDPAVNLNVKTRWNPVNPRIQIDEATLEAPHSNASGRAEISWEHPYASGTEQPSPIAVDVRSAALDLSDLLAWIRAFHAGVADDISLHGFARVSGSLRGWPSRIGAGTLAIESAELSSQRLRVPLRLGPVRIHYDERGISFTHAALFLGAEGGPLGGYVLADGGNSEQSSKGASNLRVSGHINQIRDVVATAGALGWNISRGWDVSGSAAFECVWLGSRYPWLAEPYVTLLWGGDGSGGALAAPFLNLPAEHIRATVDSRRGGQGFDLRSAEAFGAHWKGSVSHPSGAGGWLFSLNADHLVAADLDRWLNPRWRESFLDRMLPFLNSSSPVNAAPENLRASGKLSVDQFALAPYVLHRLQSDVRLAGRRIDFTSVKAQFYGGELDGSLDSDLASPPAYRVLLNFSRVDLAAFTAASPNLADLFAGAATGQIALHTRGANRADLLASFDCQGAARVNNPEIRSTILPESLRASGGHPGNSAFREASAAFTCASQKIQFQELSLLGPKTELDGSGTVDFSRNLDFRLGVFSGAASAHDARASNAPIDAFRITGPLAAPQISRATAHAARP
ncbi:MAG: AsmA-like C-terminal region-containing protein [Candidatus Acidiferrales bacterium]